MKLKSALLAFALAAALPCAFAENLMLTVPMDFDPANSFAHGGVRAIHTQPGAFTDTFHFTPGFESSWTSGHLDDVHNLDFTSANVNGNELFLSHDTYRPGYLPPVPMSGDFLMTVSGIADNNASYFASINVVAVPEPATYGMLLGGLAVLGAIAWRRKQGGNQGSAACTGAALA